MEKKTIKVTLVKSPIGCKKAHRQTVLGLGLKNSSDTRAGRHTCRPRHDQHGLLPGSC